jgi:hypothetical protein
MSAGVERVIRASPVDGGFGSLDLEEGEVFDDFGDGQVLPEVVECVAFVAHVAEVSTACVPTVNPCTDIVLTGTFCLLKG